MGVDPVAGLGVLLVIGFVIYVILYALNAGALDRYPTGFVIQVCPICEEGGLEIEERFYRSFGIPRVRRTVRCNWCRSVLREVGRRKWRYAVDGSANPGLFRHLNNEILSERDLIEIAPVVSLEEAPPQYFEQE